MIPERPDIRAALAARSAEMTPAFRTNLAAVLGGGRPRRDYRAIVSAAAAIVLGVLAVGALLAPKLAGQPQRPATVASGSRILPTSASGPRAVPTPAKAATVEMVLAPAAGKVVWVLTFSNFGTESLFRSVDGGTTWKRRGLPTYPILANPEISFVNDHEGWLFTSSGPATQCTGQSVDIWHTSDGGATWTSLGSNGIAFSQCKEGFSFVDATHGYISAWDQNHRPVIYHTSDGGHSWSPSGPLPDPPGEVSEPAGFTQRTGVVSRFGNSLLVGSFGFGRAYVYRSLDGGANWTYAATVTTATPVVRVTFLDASTWWAVGNYEIGEIITRDAGRTWQPAPSIATTAAGIVPTVLFVDGSTGYSFARDGLARTDDGGLSWKAVVVPG